MKIKINLGFCLLLVLLLSGCAGSADTKDKTLAIINGRKISYKQFEDRIAKMPSYYQALAKSHPRQLLDDIVTEQVLYEEALRKGLQNEKYIQEVFLEAKKKILITKLLEETAKKQDKISEDQIKKYYDEHIADFTVPEKVDISHIIMINQQQAEEVLGKLKNGENFEALAAQYSIDPSKEKGGELGLFKKGQLLPEFENVCFSMEEGKISDIVKTKFGYHIIRLNKKIPAHPQEPSEVADKIKLLLKEEQEKANVNELIKNLRRRSNIVINDDLLKQLEAEQPETK